MRYKRPTVDAHAINNEPLCPPPDPLRTSPPERYSNPYLPGDLHTLVGFVPVTGAVFTLLGAAMAFKAAYMWDKAGAVPGVPTVLATEAHVSGSCNA